MFVHEYMTIDKCMTNMLTSFEIMTKFSKTGFQGGRLIYPLHCYSNMAKNYKFLSSQTWSGVAKNLFSGGGTP